MALSILIFVKSMPLPSSQYMYLGPQSNNPKPPSRIPAYGPGVNPDITFANIWDREIVGSTDSTFSPSLIPWFHVEFTLIPRALIPLPQVTQALYDTREVELFKYHTTLGLIPFSIKELFSLHTST
jgi:hypothetical protein